MDAITATRTYDRGRGFFCDTDKAGNPLSQPPRLLEPRKTKDNPRGVRHPGKTRQDHLPVAQRDRVAAAQKRATLPSKQRQA